MKKVESAKWDAQRPIEKLEIKHSERMTDSEKEKFALIKSINDIEMELQKLEASLALQKQQIMSTKQNIVSFASKHKKNSFNQQTKTTKRAYLTKRGQRMLDEDVPH